MSHPLKLGKYQVTGVLGEGAMGVVYKGFDPDIRRIVALKTVRRALLDSNEQGAPMLARFRNEARAAGRLMHPGIVAVYDFGDEDDVAYIAMEFVEGETLQRYVASQVRFTLDDVVSVVCQLLDALEHAHEQGVWHRDIKPANLLMTRQGRLKVADFGIARIESACLTQVTSVIGTPGYMAPEQFLGQDIDRRVDIYGTGVLLYQLLVGSPPFVGSAESLSYRVVHEAPVLPSAVPGSRCGTRFDSAIAIALAKDPAQRWASAAAFKQALVASAGAPVAATVSEATVIALPARVSKEAQAGQRGQPSSADDAPATAWQGTVLADVERSLARHIGPLASVLVRRMSRECTDLPSLVNRLASQVTDAAARETFLTTTSRYGAASGASSAGRSAAGGPSAHGSAGARPPDGAVPAATSAPTSAPVTEALVEQSTRLLAAQMGPIAKVVVKRALSAHTQREPFFHALLDAVDDAAAREKLRTELARLH